jgi:hypothetical protein
MPYFIKNKKGKVVLIIDTTGAINQINETYPSLNILFNKDKMIVKIPTPDLLHMKDTPINKGVAVEQPFDKNVNQVFNGKKMVEGQQVKTLQYFVQILTYPIVVASLFSLFVVMYPVIALLGQFFASVFFSLRISYMTACRLLIVSSTPMLVFLLVIMTLDSLFSFTGVFLVGLLFLYYSFALFSLKKDSRKVVAQ